jgi:hypothetical protein
MAAMETVLWLLASVPLSWGIAAWIDRKGGW